MERSYILSREELALGLRERDGAEAKEKVTLTLLLRDAGLILNVDVLIVTAVFMLECGSIFKLATLLFVCVCECNIGNSEKYIICQS